MRTITQDYAKEMSEYICSQIDVEIAHPANLSPEGKEVYHEVLTTNDDSFKNHISLIISDFIG